ncbi:hypothetical protein PN499_11240 [Kamptonema animale CS-326]|uniref:hypothetical protein n=1 Tax=Kamptonema TaxID=1501433 RepID=UPI0011D1FF13|nr:MULTISPECIES: hypothetical protein [Kamptonema]MDB9511760.1 hypothetical protein [Kamptonema animale CS-326]
MLVCLERLYKSRDLPHDLHDSVGGLVSPAPKTAKISGLVDFRDSNALGGRKVKSERQRSQLKRCWAIASRG